MDLGAQDLEGLRAAGEACRHLHRQGLLAAGDGNLSLRLADGRIALTPAGVNKSRLCPEQWALLSPEGDLLRGEPSSERAMHLAVYRRCPQARAVLHAHPPTAIAWTLAFPDLAELPAEALPELILAAGRIPVAPYRRPGTEALAEALVPFLPGHRLLLMARHGALAWGETLEEALDGIERLEHVSRILLQARLLGGAVPLPAAELGALQAMRAQRGPRTR